MACPQRGRNHLGTGAGASEVPTCPKGLLELQQSLQPGLSFLMGLLGLSSIYEQVLAFVVPSYV